jgi:acyl dehydratase
VIPDIEALRTKLVGHRFPGGTVTVAPHEAWLGHDAMCSPNRGSATLDPLWILVAGLRGMGLDVAGVIDLAGATTEDGVLFGELGLRQDVPLQAGVEYAVSGAIVEVTRRTGRRAGAFDMVAFELQLHAGETPVASVTSAFLFPRPTAAPAPPSPAPDQLLVVGESSSVTPARRPSAHGHQGVGAVPEQVVVVEAWAMKVFALLLDDPNPIHWDVEAARALGLGERPVNQGGLNVGYVIGALTEWSGSSAAVRDVRVRFHGTVRAGDRVTAGGEIDEEHDGLAHLRVWLRDEEGTDLVAGTATVAVGGHG